MPSLLAHTTFGLTLGLFSLSALGSQTSGAQTSAQTVLHGQAQPSSETSAGDATAPAASSGQAALGQESATSSPVAKAAKAGEKAKVKKAKKLKITHMKIQGGTLTVDGFTGKAALNYDIADLRYLHMYVPGSGTVIVARDKFPGAVEQKDAFHQQGLTVNAGGHTVELYSEQLLLSKKPESAWVRLDSDFKLRSTYPVFGYGDTTAAPYSWPGALRMAPQTGVADAPPLPPALLPAFAPKPVPVKLSATPAAPSGPSSLQAHPETKAFPKTLDGVAGRCHAAP